MRFPALVRASILLALPLLGACGGAACPGGAVEVPTRPPSPLPEEPQTAPTAGMVWIAGYWSYGPTPQPIWTWIPGHWLTAPEGERWVAARTTGEPGDARYRFQPGAFCK